MKYQCLKRKIYLLNLLKLEKCYNVELLANKLEVSSRTIKRDIQELKEMGASIRYCKQLNGYILENAFDLEHRIIDYL